MTIRRDALAAGRCGSSRRASRRRPSRTTSQRSRELVGRLVADADAGDLQPLPPRRLGEEDREPAAAGQQADRSPVGRRTRRPGRVGETHGTESLLGIGVRTATSTEPASCPPGSRRPAGSSGFATASESRSSPSDPRSASGAGGERGRQQRRPGRPARGAGGASRGAGRSSGRPGAARGRGWPASRGPAGRRGRCGGPRPGRRRSTRSPISVLSLIPAWPAMTT